MIFLTAEWRYLLILNYEVSREILTAYLPACTELDSWNGQPYVSLVGFLFIQPRIAGILPIPFHPHFEEINLRFYVRRKSGNDWHHGVVFLREIISKPLIAWTANITYGEQYRVMPTRHSPRLLNRDFHTGERVEFSWRPHSGWNHLSARVGPGSDAISPGSAEEFFLIKNWGYSRLTEKSSREYRVDHPYWRVWQAVDPSVHCDVPQIFGPEFTDPLSEPPASMWFANGSPVVMHPWRPNR